jgi:hypothetical protein
MPDAAKLSMLARKFYFEFLALRDGGSHQQFDYKCYRRLTDKLDNLEIKLSESGIRFVEMIVEERIQSGRLQGIEKARELLKLQDSALQGLRFFWREMAADEAMKTHHFKPQPATVDALLAAEALNRVREICASANPAWPSGRRQWLPDGMDAELINEERPTLAEALSRHANEFIAAKKDRRYPKSVNRPTSQIKRLWFISVALAGAVYGVELRTAIDALGATRPEEETQQMRESILRPKRKDK